MRLERRYKSYSPTLTISLKVKFSINYWRAGFYWVLIRAKPVYYGSELYNI
jgi:hypothetical protein